MPVSKKIITNRPKFTKKRSSLDITPEVIVKASESQIKAFFDFLRTQGVVGLAVGLVLGGAVSIMVKSLVDNIIMPPLGLLLGSAEGLKGLTWIIGKTADGALAVLHYGIFLNDFINFVVIALVVYFIIHFLKVEKIDKKKS